MLELQSVLAEERSLYNAYAPSYRTSALFGSYFYRQERRIFVDWLLARLGGAGHDVPSLSYLDVGCGTGDVLELLADAGCARLTGLDVAEATLSPRHHRSSPHVRLIHGSIEECDFGGETFDVIVCFLTLHHLLDPGAFFDLVDRQLAPGGSFAVFEYDPTSWWTKRGWKTLVHGLAMPLRLACRFKNRAALARLEEVPARFNPAHRLRAPVEIRAAMRNPEGYELETRARGVFIPSLKDVLVGDSALDRALYRGIDRIDGIAVHATGGFFHYLMGTRRA